MSKCVGHAQNVSADVHGAGILFRLMDGMPNWTPIQELMQTILSLIKYMIVRNMKRKKDEKKEQRSNIQRRKIN